MMCIESEVVLNLCELYPKTAMRLKWLALKKREQLVKIYDTKQKEKTWVPTQVDNNFKVEDLNTLDRKFEKFEIRNQRQFSFDLLKSKHNVTMDSSPDQ